MNFKWLAERNRSEEERDNGLMNESSGFHFAFVQRNMMKVANKYVCMEIKYIKTETDVLKKH